MSFGSTEEFPLTLNHLDSIESMIEVKADPYYPINSPQQVASTHEGNPINCPSSHYYINSNGHLQIRPIWWFYTSCRRLIASFIPGMKSHSNSYVSTPLITNTMSIMVIFIIRTILNQTLQYVFNTQQIRACHDFSREFVNFFSFSIFLNLFLCLPALNWDFFCIIWMKMEQRIHNKPNIKSSFNHSRRQLFIFYTICEVLVIFEILYLIYILCTLIFAAVDSRVGSTNHSLWKITYHCVQDLPFGDAILFLLAQCIGLLTYTLRWKQIICFHRLHQHIFHERGVIPGRTRFEYVAYSFKTPWFASSHTKRVHELKRQFYNSALRGNVEKIQILLHQAIDLDGPSFATHWYHWETSSIPFFGSFFAHCFVQCKRNPLHVAIVFGHTEVVELLLQYGFNVLEYEKMEILQLNISWLYRSLFDVIPWLHSANHTHHTSRAIFGLVSPFTYTLLTPLHVAVTMGHYDMVLILLRHGADPNQIARSSFRKYATPPLYYVINRECVRLLLDADANPLFVPGHGYYVTSYTVMRLNGSHVIASEMEKYGGDVALTPLHDACARGLEQQVRFYLEHGHTSPDTLGEKESGCFHRTPLHWAAIRGETKSIELLLQFGANVDARDVFGRTPLIWACLLNRVEAVRILLEHGNADVNIRDNIGDPLLCICAAGTCSNLRPNGHFVHNMNEKSRHDSSSTSIDPDLFMLLMEAGIDLHAIRESTGDSPLHVALRKNNEATSILFLRAGMSLTALNFMGERAIDCTTSPTLRYAIKKEAGQRDVMISYCHSHAGLARKVRDALERAHVTTWIDSMDPSGITGGSVWRQEIAQGIQSSALVLALLTADYPSSQWCMKELAFAKLNNIPVVAIQCEDMIITEELQVYLWTRQVVDFRSAFLERVVVTRQEEEDMSRVVEYAYDEDTFQICMHLLLDGIHDQIEEHRIQKFKRQRQLERSSEDEGLRLQDGLNRINDTEIERLEDELDALNLSSHSYVYIAHGDFHMTFCLRLQVALQKQGIRCIVDQSLPSTQYDTTPNPRPSQRTNSSTSHNSRDQHATRALQARQLAAKDAILECSAVIVVLSPMTTKCDILADQVAFAEDRGKFIVPLLLSLQTIDLAKRYTFSRSILQHFNISIGFEQSLERLAIYLQQSTSALERQQVREETTSDQSVSSVYRHRRRGLIADDIEDDGRGRKSANLLSSCASLVSFGNGGARVVSPAPLHVLFPGGNQENHENSSTDEETSPRPSFSTLPPPLQIIQPTRVVNVPLGTHSMTENVDANRSPGGNHGQPLSPPIPKPRSYN